ncbi:MAG: shikimate kinase [Pseudomonadota bacterium]
MTKPDLILDPSRAVVTRLASRVRAARAALGLPRRELSERSGVSPRYLAQLEAGEGNISIVLLSRVAAALDVAVEDLLRETAQMPADVSRVAQLYADAPATVQGRVRAILAPENPQALRAQRVCLVGLRGAGKSTLGAAVASKLKVPFVELSDRIEAKAGIPTSEIIALYGEDGYRNIEAEVLEQVISSHDKLIMAVSGGIVGSPDNYNQVLERCHTIWVRTSAAEHIARVRARGEAGRSNPTAAAMDQVKTLLASRGPAYERALAQVDTTSKPIQMSVNDVLTVIAKHRFLERIGAV